MKTKSFKDMTVNEHGAAFLNIWYYYYNTERKEEYPGWFESPAFKSSSLKCKTESLINGDRLMDKMEKVKKCLSF